MRTHLQATGQSVADPRQIVALFSGYIEIIPNHRWFCIRQLESKDPYSGAPRGSMTLGCISGANEQLQTNKGYLQWCARVMLLNSPDRHIQLFRFLTAYSALESREAQHRRHKGMSSYGYPM